MRNIFKNKRLSDSLSLLGHSRNLIGKLLSGGLVSCCLSGSLMAAAPQESGSKPTPAKLNSVTPQREPKVKSYDASKPLPEEGAQKAEKNQTAASQSQAKNGKAPNKLLATKPAPLPSTNGLSRGPKFQSAVEGQLGIQILPQASKYSRPYLHGKGWVPLMQNASMVTYGSVQLLPGFSLNPNQSGIGANSLALFKNWTGGIGARKFNVNNASFFGGFLGALVTGNGPAGGASYGGRIAAEFGMGHYKGTVFGGGGFNTVSDSDKKSYKLANNFGVSGQGNYRGISFDVNIGSYLGQQVVTPGSFNLKTLNSPIWVRFQVMALPLKFFKVKLSLGYENLLGQKPKNQAGVESDFSFADYFTFIADVDLLTHATLSQIPTTSKQSNPIDFNNLVASYAEQAPGLAFRFESGDSMIALSKNPIVFKNDEKTSLVVKQKDVGTDESYQVRSLGFVTLENTTSGSQSSNSRRMRRSANSVIALTADKDNGIDQEIELTLKSVENLAGCDVLPVTKMVFEKTTKQDNQTTTDILSEEELYIGNFEGSAAIEKDTYKISVDESSSESKKRGLGAKGARASSANQTLLGTRTPALYADLKIELTDSSSGALPSSKNVMPLNVEPVSWDEEKNGLFRDKVQFWMEKGSSTGSYQLLFADAASDTMSEALKSALKDTQYRLSYYPNAWALTGLSLKDPNSSDGDNDDQTPPPAETVTVSAITTPSDVTKVEEGVFQCATLAEGGALKVKSSKNNEETSLKLSQTDLTSLGANKTIDLKAAFSSDTQHPVSFKLQAPNNDSAVRLVRFASSAALIDKQTLENSLVQPSDLPGTTQKAKTLLDQKGLTARLATAEELMKFMKSYGINVNNNGTPSQEMDKASLMLGYAQGDLEAYKGEKIQAYCSKAGNATDGYAVLDLMGSMSQPIEVDTSATSGNGALYYLVVSPKS